MPLPLRSRILCGVAVLYTIELILIKGSPVTRPWFDTDDFRRCMGMPCEAWEEVKQIVRELKEETHDEELPGLYSRVLGSGVYEAKADVLPGADNAIEGDIFLSLPQALQFKENIKTRRKRKLGVFSETSNKWELPIRFYLDSEFTSTQKAAIIGATHHYQDQTCIRFTELSLIEAIVERDPFLYFVKSESMCGTFIGQVTILHPQPIMLKDECIEQWGAIVHEMGHILGLWHEHQRADRDNHVTIFPDRMKLGADSNQFSKGLTRDLLPYDYGSVMHYWAWAFSASINNVTIMPHDPLYLHTIGQTIGLSFLDSKLINIAYCEVSCTNVVYCYNSGYQDPNDCYSCTCPDGFSGQYCDRLAPAQKADCGGTIHLGGSGDDLSTYLKSPGYDTAGSYYEDRTECTWLIEVPEGYRVSLRIMLNRTTDHFGMYCMYRVCFHYVEVKLQSSDLSVTGPRFCCNAIGPNFVVPGVLTSEGRHMMVLMRSNFTSIDDRYKRGFRAYVWAARDDSPTAETHAPPTTAPTTQPTTPPTTTQADTTTRAPPGGGRYAVIDVVFIMDSSGSVGKRNWETIKSFAKTIISQFTLGTGNVRFGFVSFGTSGYLNMDLDDFYSKDKMFTKIDTLPWKDGFSNLADGLRKAQRIFSQSSGNKPKLAILLTDGPASAGQSATLEEARNVRNAHLSSLMIIGVTRRVNTKEIYQMASMPSADFVRLVSSFDGLRSIVSHVVTMINRLGETSPGQPTTPETTTAAPTTTARTTPATLTTAAATASTVQTTVTTTIQTTETTETAAQTTARVTDTPNVPPSNYNWHCDFEKNSEPVCDMAQERRPGVDQVDWTRRSGRTPSEPTGPSRAYSGNYYIYLEASGQTPQYGKATIYTPEVPHTGDYCLQFNYNMFGFHIYRLIVKLISSSNQEAELFFKEGQQESSGNVWRSFSEGVRMVEKSKISFTAQKGKAFSGDIAIDNIRLTDGPC